MSAICIAEAGGREQDPTAVEHPRSIPAAELQAVSADDLVKSIQSTGD
jgi:hypothetical protein